MSRDPYHPVKYLNRMRSICIICKKPGILRPIGNPELLPIQTKADMRVQCDNHFARVNQYKTIPDLMEFWESNKLPNISQRIVYMVEESKK